MCASEEKKQQDLSSVLVFFSQFTESELQVDGASEVCCKWEQALLSHENMQKGVFPTSVFTKMQLNLSGVGCELHKLETLLLGESCGFVVFFFPPIPDAISS